MGRLFSSWRCGLSRAVVVIATCSALLTPNSASADLVRPDDPLPSPLRIGDAIDLARASRQEIAAARARSRAFSERPAIVSALDDPMISPSIDHLPFMLHGLDASLTLEQRFPLSRVRGHRERGAEADARRARADSDRVELDVELNATRAFYMLHERRRMADVIEKELELAKDLRMAANARYAALTGGQADILRAEIEVARFEGMLRASRSDIQAGEAMLNVSLGRAASGEIPMLEATVTTTVPPTLDEVVARAFDLRPELRAGRAEISRSEAEVSVMESMYWPMAMVRTGPAYTMADGAGCMLMLGISIPIWRERLSAGVREAEAMVDMSRADVKAVARMVEGEAASARSDLEANRVRYLALRDEILPRARRVIDPALAGYTAGTLPLVSIVEAARSLWGSEADLISAEVELGIAWARLRRAVGNQTEEKR